MADVAVFGEGIATDGELTMALQLCALCSELWTLCDSKREIFRKLVEVSERVFVPWKSRFSVEQLEAVLCVVVIGMPIADPTFQLGISELRFFRLRTAVLQPDKRVNSSKFR